MILITNAFVVSNSASLEIFKLIFTDGNHEPPRKKFPFIWSKNGGNRLVSPSFGQKTTSLKKVVRKPVKFL